MIFMSPWSLDYFFTKIIYKRSSWSWSYGSWIYNNLCNQYLSPLMLWVRIPLRRGVLNTTLCTPVSFDNKTDCHDITGILLKMLLNTIKQTTLILYAIFLTPACTPKLSTIFLTPLLTKIIYHILDPTFHQIMYHILDPPFLLIKIMYHILDPPSLRNYVPYLWPTLSSHQNYVPYSWPPFSPKLCTIFVTSLPFSLKLCTFSSLILSS